MRLFIAMEPDARAKNSLVCFREELRSRATGRYVRDDQLHLTLLFLGEMAPAHLPGIKAAMNQAAQAFAPVPLSLGTPGLFRNISVIHIESDLMPLHHALTGAMLPFGVKPENRPFRPHITIARDTKKPQAWPNISPAQWAADEIVLFESRFGQRLQYIPIHRTRLQL